MKIVKLLRQEMAKDTNTSSLSVGGVHNRGSYS